MKTTFNAELPTTTVGNSAFTIFVMCFLLFFAWGMSQSAHAKNYNITGLVREHSCQIEGIRHGKNVFLSLADIQNRLPVEVLDDSVARIVVLAGVSDCVPVFYDDEQEFLSEKGMKFVAADALGKSFGCDKHNLRKGSLQFTGGGANSWLRPGVDSGRVAPGFSLKNELGAEVSLVEALKSSSVLLAFVRSGKWDPLSKDMLKSLNTNAEQMQKAGYQILAVHGYEEFDGKSWQDSLKISLPLLADSYSAVMRGYQVYDTGSNPVPTIFLIDRSGVIRFKKSYPKEIVEFEVGEVVERIK